MSKAKEFEVIRVRPEEMKELANVLTNYWIFDEEPIDINLNTEDELIETEEKVMALISGYIA